MLMTQTLTDIVNGKFSVSAGPIAAAQQVNARMAK